MTLLRKIFGRDKSRTTNPALLKSLHAFSRNPTPKVRAQLYKALLGSTPVVALGEAPPAALTGDDTGEHTFVAPHDLSLPLFGARDDKGTPNAVAFTDMDSMLNWNPDCRHYIALPAKVLLGIIVANPELVGLAINPSSHGTAWLTVPECATLARGELPGYQDEKISTSPLQEGTRIGLRPAESPPAHLAHVLRAQCEKCADIDAAYLLEMKINDDPPKLTVALECSHSPSPARKGELTQLLGKNTEPILGGKSDITFLFLESPQLLSMARQCPHFFKAR